MSQFRIISNRGHAATINANDRQHAWRIVTGKEDRLGGNTRLLDWAGGECLVDIVPNDGRSRTEAAS